MTRLMARANPGIYVIELVLDAPPTTWTAIRALSWRAAEPAELEALRDGEPYVWPPETWYILPI
jgi:hypothetical protein